MTISTVPIQDMNIGKLCRLAYLQATLINEHQNLNDAQGQYARDLLDTIIGLWEAKGLLARSTEFAYLSLVVGQAKYSLPTDVLDVIGDGMYIAASETDIQNPEGLTFIQAIDQESWQRMGTNAAEGVPTRMYPHRASNTVQLWLWPTPDESGTVRYRKLRLFAGASDANATMDFERPWAQAFIYELAHQLARGRNLPLDKCRELERVAAQKYEECRGFAAEKEPGVVYMGHVSNWSHR